MRKKTKKSYSAKLELPRFGGVFRACVSSL